MLKGTPHEEPACQIPSWISLRTLIFLLDMVLPQLDAIMPTVSCSTYNHGSVLSWRNSKHEANKAQSLRLNMCMKPMLASCHPVAHRRRSYLDLQRSDCYPHVSPWNLCATGNLGSMESNVMAGRALFGRFQLLMACAAVLFS